MFALTFVHNALSVSIANALAIATTLRHCTHTSFHLVLAASYSELHTVHILDQPLNNLHAIAICPLHSKSLNHGSTTINHNST